MDEPVPWEIVQMPVSASHEKTCRDGIGVGSFFAVGMYEMRVFRTEPVFLDLEEIGIEFCEQPTFDASEPTRKRSNWCPYVRFGGQGIHTSIGRIRRDP